MPGIRALAVWTHHGLYPLGYLAPLAKALLEATDVLLAVGHDVTQHGEIRGAKMRRQCIE